MNSKTKNSVSEEILEKMADKAFPMEKIKSAKELTEGYFNTAYLIIFESGFEAILKIAPLKEIQVQSYETDIMKAEVECMELVRQTTKVPVPKVLFHDFTHAIYESDYFFMSKLEGDSLNSIKETLTEEEKDSIELNTGKYNKEINSITGESFGYYNKVDGHRPWFEVFRGFLKDLFGDAGRISLDIGLDYTSVEGLLEKHKEFFSEVTTPRLVHWDLWEGNIFIKDKNITGLIDFERCMWADVLLEVGFRSHNQKPDFLEGYGKRTFTEAEDVRILWYDLYLFVAMSMECDYRGYPDRGMYYWAKEQIEKKFAELKLK